MPLDADALKVILEHQTNTIKDLILAHAEQSNKRHSEMLEVLKSSVPEGDFDAHRRAHEGMIEDAKWRKNVRKEVFTKISTGAAWAMFVGFCMAVWEWVKSQAHR